MSNKINRTDKIRHKRSVVQKRAAACPERSIWEQKSLIQCNVKLAVFVLIVTYYMLDYMMMNEADDIPAVLIVIFTLLAPSTLYSYYVYDYQKGLGPKDGTDVPRFITDKKKFTIIGWLSVTIWGIIVLILEPVVVPRFFPVLDDTYYQSQIMLMLFIAPVIEEIIFRYLLYDRWLKQKFGWFWGFVIASLIFVVFHPVTNVHALIIYWAPTLLFFLIYQEFGLYGAIVTHMLYNMIVI